MTFIILKDWEAAGLNAGRITQLRRVVKRRMFDREARDEDNSGWCVTLPGDNYTPDMVLSHFPSPYAVGDILWCKETWAEQGCTGHSRYHGEQDADWVIYRADRDVPGVRWRSPVVMARGDSRLSIQVTEVRVVRAQDVTYEDVVALGCPGPHIGAHPDDFEWYRNTYNSTAKRGALYDDNRWEFAYGVRRVEA